MTENPAILLVEDNPDDRLLALRALERSHIANEIVVLRDGPEALEFLLPPAAPTHPLPVVVLLDVRLPKIDGLEVLRQIREDERTRHQPVMVLISEESDRARAEQQHLEHTAYLHKPLKFQDLARAAGELGLSWEMTEPRPEDRERTCA